MENGFIYKNLKKIILFTLCYIAIFSMFSISVYADNSHWAEKQMNQWKNDGLLVGAGEGELEADNSITRAQFMQLVNNMMGYRRVGDDILKFKDVSVDEWYYQTVAIALEAGYIRGVSDDMMNPNGKITREQAMVILARISKSRENSRAYQNAKDSGDVSNWAKVAVSICINEGFISGNTNGDIMPLANLSVAEAVTMLNRKYRNQRVFALEGEYDFQGEIVNNVMILADNIYLENVNVTGEAVITEAASNGIVALGGNFAKIKNNAVDIDLMLLGEVHELELNAGAKLAGEFKVNQIKVLNEAVKLELVDAKGNAKILDNNIKKVEINDEKVIINDLAIKLEDTDREEKTTKKTKVTKSKKDNNDDSENDDDEEDVTIKQTTAAAITVVTTKEATTE